MFVEPMMNSNVVDAVNPLVNHMTIQNKNPLLSVQTHDQMGGGYAATLQPNQKGEELQDNKTKQNRNLDKRKGQLTLVDVDLEPSQEVLQATPYPDIVKRYWSSICTPFCECPCTGSL